MRLTPLPSGLADWWMHAQVVAWPTASSAASRPPYPGRKAGASAGKHVLCSSQARLPLRAYGELVDAYAGGGWPHRIKRGVVPTLSRAEGHGLCWLACLTLKQPTFLLKANGESSPALSRAEGRGLCWQACPVLKSSPPPSSGRTASSWTRTRAVVGPTASSTALFPPARGWKATASAG